MSRSTSSSMLLRLLGKGKPDWLTCVHLNPKKDRTARTITTAPTSQTILFMTFVLAFSPCNQNACEGNLFRGTDYKSWPRPSSYPPIRRRRHRRRECSSVWLRCQSVAPEHDIRSTVHSRLKWQGNITVPAPLSGPSKLRFGWVSRRCRTYTSSRTKGFAADHDR